MSAGVGVSVSMGVSVGVSESESMSVGVGVSVARAYHASRPLGKCRQIGCQLAATPHAPLPRQ